MLVYRLGIRNKKLETGGFFVCKPKASLRKGRCVRIKSQIIMKLDIPVHFKLEDPERTSSGSGKTTTSGLVFTLVGPGNSGLICKSVAAGIHSTSDGCGDGKSPVIRR
jgi:hypothetical protein